ncbi:MAG: Hsp70 family protein [Phycisphaerales bacterium]|nr:Hsp70 family protein [Phycisphaerales bacterium]
MAGGDDLIVGIDLGTTFSLLAYVDRSGVQVIRDENGEARFPSVVSLRPRDGGGTGIVAGWDARRRAVEHPRTTVHSALGLIGRGLADVEGERRFLAYELAAGPRDSIQIRLGDEAFSPEQIAAHVLSALKSLGERQLGRPIRRAIITVPAYFDDAQRNATRHAAQIAGLEVVRMINEPTAAALAYGIGLRGAIASSWAPCENGLASNRDGPISLPLPHCSENDGGAALEPQSSDAAAESSKSGSDHAETVAVYDLGGGTFDVSILRIESGVFQVLSTGGDTHLGGDDFDREIIQLIETEVARDFNLPIDSPATRQGLRALSEAVKIRLSEALDARIELDLGAGRTYFRTLTRDEFESRIAALVDRTLQKCDQALRDAHLAPEQIDQVVLVGGSTRVPLVRRRVEERFRRRPYTALNPDEVVAIGAAIQGSVLGGERPDMLLLDVASLSLGVETLGGAMSKLILRNTTIPSRATEMFTTFVDGQTAIQIRVLQGERELAADCRVLGEFVLGGLPPMPAGIPKVEVEFLIDANGILNVAARELRSGRAARIQVIPNHGLTRDEAEHMAREAIKHARADLDAHRRIDLLNQIAFDTAKAEQMLGRVAHLLDAAKRETIEQEIAALRELAKQPPSDLNDLQRALQRFGQGTLSLAEIGIREALRSA